VCSSDGREESTAAAEGRNGREESVAAAGVRCGWARMRIGLGFHAAAVYKYARAVEVWAGEPPFRPAKLAQNISGPFTSKRPNCKFFCISAQNFGK